MRFVFIGVDRVVVFWFLWIFWDSIYGVVRIRVGRLGNEIRIFE